MKKRKNYRRIYRRSCSNCDLLRIGSGSWWCARDGENESTEDIGDVHPLEMTCDRWYTYHYVNEKLDALLTGYVNPHGSEW